MVKYISCLNLGLEGNQSFVQFPFLSLIIKSNTDDFIIHKRNH